MKNLVDRALRWSSHKKRLIKSITQGDSGRNVAPQKRDGYGVGAHAVAAIQCWQVLRNAEGNVDNAVVVPIRAGAVEVDNWRAIAVGKNGNDRWRNGL